MNFLRLLTQKLDLDANDAFHIADTQDNWKDKKLLYSTIVDELIKNVANLLIVSEMDCESDAYSDSSSNIITSYTLAGSSGDFYTADFNITRPTNIYFDWGTGNSGVTSYIQAFIQLKTVDGYIEPGNFMARIGNVRNYSVPSYRNTWFRVLNPGIYRMHISVPSASGSGTIYLRTNGIYGKPTL